MRAGGISPGMKEHIVRLTDGARRKLQELVESGARSVRVVRRAMILLKSDAGLTDQQIVEHVGCAERTVRNVRKRYCDAGLEGALHDSPRSGRPPDFTARQKQQVVAHLLLREILTWAGFHGFDGGLFGYRQ